MNSSTRLRWIWIACFAILMNALAPAISHAVNGKPRTWEICLNDGTRISGVGELDAAAFQAAIEKRQPAMQMDMEDCAYCLPHAGAAGLPPSDAAPLLLADSGPALPFLFYRSPQPLQIWSAASPRGPPARS